MWSRASIDKPGIDAACSLKAACFGKTRHAVLLSVSVLAYMTAR